MTSPDYFQRLTGGGTFNRALAIFAKRYDLFLIVTGIIFVPLVAANITMMSLMGSSMQTFMDAMDTSNRFLQEYSYQSGTANNEDLSALLMAQSGLFWAQLFVEFVIFMVFALAGRAAMSYAVGLLYAGRDPHWCECFKVGFRKWCAVFCAAMIVGLCMGVGNLLTQVIAQVFFSISPYLLFISIAIMIAWLVFIIFVYVSLVILIPVIMIENLGSLDGIKRAWTLSWNNRCYIFCTLFCFLLVYYLGILVLAVIIGSVGGSNALFTAVGSIALTLPSLVFLPIATILETVVYLNIRVQREALNVDVLIKDLDGDQKLVIEEYADNPSVKMTAGYSAPSKYVPVTEKDAEAELV